MSYEHELFNLEKEYPVFFIIHDEDEHTSSVMRHWHQELEFNYTAHGSVKDFFIAGEHYNTDSGDILLINSYDIHGVQNINDGTQHDEVLSIIVPLTFIDRYCPVINDFRFDINQIDKFDQQQKEGYCHLQRLMENLLSLAKRPFTELNNLKVVTAMMEVMLLLLEYFIEKKVEKHKGPEIERLKKVILYIQDHYHQQLTLEEIASEVYVSAGYLSRYFKQMMGLTLYQYIETIRCMHAVEELQRGVETIEIVALNNGFTDAKSLNRVLKKLYGKTAKWFK